MARYKQCRYNGKRMRYHRMLLILLLKPKSGEPSESLLKKLVVHHINGDGMDNRRENIRIMKVSEHNKLHASMRKRDKKGRFK